MIFDISKKIFDIKNKVDFLYQQIEFLILEYHFLISKYRLIFWYQKNRFSISENKSYIKWMNALCDATFVIWKKLCFKPVKNNKVCLVLYPISFWLVRLHIQRLVLLAKRFAVNIETILKKKLWRRIIYWRTTSVFNT